MNGQTKLKQCKKIGLENLLVVKINFKIEGSDDIDSIKCFTTDPTLLFGLSFIALSIDHPLAKYYSNDEKFFRI